MSDNTPGWLTAIRRLLPLLAAGILVGAGLGALAAALLGSSYEATASMNVTTPEGSIEVDDSFGHILGQLATRPSVVAEDLTRAGFTELASDPATAIGVESATDAPSFEITATADTADEAAEIANTAASAVHAHTEARSEETGVVANVLAEAEAPENPSSLSWALGALAGAALGLSTAILIALARRPSG
jgi:uncharacterized protein involved in exopolysaccharide biosynthesis